MTEDLDPMRQAAEELLRKLGGLDRAGRLLRELGAHAAERYLEATERRRVCRAMLDARDERPDIRDQLMRMGMSERSAYRLIDSVLCQRGCELARALGKISP